MQLLEKSKAETPPNNRSSLDELCEQVRAQTIQALVSSKVILEAEGKAFEEYLLTHGVTAGEILSKMAELRGIAEAEKGAAIAHWGRLVSPVIKKRYALIPFADRLLGANAIFTAYPELKEAAAALKCPIIFAEDCDVLGFGTLNPVVASLFGAWVEDYLASKLGVRPYLSLFLLDLARWETLCRRQFGQ